MSKYPISAVCPDCGSRNSFRKGRDRVCGACHARYTPPASLAERVMFGIVFIIPGFLLTLAAGASILGMLSAKEQPLGCFGLAAAAGVLGFACIGWGIKELGGRQIADRPQAISEDRPLASDDERPEVIEDLSTSITAAANIEGIARTPSAAPAQRRITEAVPAPLPAELAESIVRQLAEKHGAKGVLQRLGRFPPAHLRNARESFARGLSKDETPLVFVDTSFLKNGKAGLLLTNEKLYSSRTTPFALHEITEVKVQEPSPLMIVYMFFLLALVLLPRLLRGAVMAFPGVDPGWGSFLFCMYPLSAVLVFVLARMGGGYRKHRYELIVNTVTVYEGGRPLRTAFWRELLGQLAVAAFVQERIPTARRAGPLSRPESLTLETCPHGSQGEPLAVEFVHDAAWGQIEQAVRALDGHSHPLVRLWAGEPEQAPGLEVIGGNGKYVLREVEDGWVYYDSGKGDEEVKVQTSGEGYRCPAYYVCTDLEQVLRVARRFCETGTFEEETA
jgi:hypothetical protein